MKTAAVTLAVVLAAACGCSRNASSSQSSIWSPFESARKAPPPSNASIQAIALGTHAERVHQLIGQPDFWGHLDAGLPAIA